MDFAGAQPERNIVQHLDPGKTLTDVLEFQDIFTHLTGAASSSQIVNATPAPLSCSPQSADNRLSVNKHLIFSGRTKEVRSSLPNLDESTRANNCCDDSITFRF